MNIQSDGRDKNNHEIDRQAAVHKLKNSTAGFLDWIANLTSGRVSKFITKEKSSTQLSHGYLTISAF